MKSQFWENYHWIVTYVILTANNKYFNFNMKMIQARTMSSPCSTESLE